MNTASSDGVLSGHVEVKLRDPKERAVPAGLAVDKATRRLFVANVWGHRLTRVDLLPEPKAQDIPLSTNVAALTAAPVAPSTDFDTAAANKRAEAALFEENPADTFPYGCLLDEKHDRLYVSLWAARRWPSRPGDGPRSTDVARPGASMRNGPRPAPVIASSSPMPIRIPSRVFDTASANASKQSAAALYPHSPPGSTPNSLALCPDDKTLFIAERR